MDPTEKMKVAAREGWTTFAMAIPGKAMGNIVQISERSDVVCMTYINAPFGRPN